MPHFRIAAGDSLRFRLRLAFQGYQPDSLSIKVSTTDSALASFRTVLLLREGTNYPPNATTWYRYAVSLNAYAGQKVYVALKHYNVDGDGLYIDDVQLGTPPAADATVSSIILPGAVGVGSVNTPQVSVKNSGVATQTFPVDLTIGAYSSMRTATALAPGASVTLTFDPWTPPAPGTVAATATATMADDANLGDNQMSRNILVAAPLTTATSAWRNGPAMPTGRWAHGLSGSDRKAFLPDSAFVYAVTGADGSFANTATVQCLSAATNTWSARAPIPVSRTQVMSNWIKGKLYVAGGYGGSFSPVSRLDIYDPATNTWTLGASMLQAVGDYASAVYKDSLLYIMGGYTGSGDVNAVQIYNPTTDTWASGTTATGVAVAGGRMGIVGNEIVAVGGYSQVLAATQSQTRKGVINPADPTQITWSTLANYPAGPAGRLGSGALALGKHPRVYFSGGDPNGQGTQTLTATWAYDLATNEWLIGPALGTGVSNVMQLAPLVANDSVYLVCTGGYNGSAVISTTQLLNLGQRDAVLDRSDLIISDVRSVSGGDYRNVTVTATGQATFTGSVDALAAVSVQTGGSLRLEAPLTGTATFELQPGATLAVQDAGGISAAGATGAVRVTGTRTFASGATYVYAGTTAQQTGSGLPAMVDNLTIDNPANVMLTNDLGVARVLTLANAGNLTTSDVTLTLLSDATGTGMVVNSSTGVVSGLTTVQRYITPGLNPGLGYRHLSSPVTNSTVNDLTCSGYTPVINTAFNGTAYPSSVRPYPNVFGFNETRFPTSSNFDLGYFSPAALNSALVPGRGYAVYMPGSSKPDFVGTLGNGTLTMTGLTKTGNFMGSNQKSGWHMLGNPYPAPIDWDNVSIPAGMSSSVSVFQTSGINSGQYLTRANGMGTLPDGLIPMGQGIFVRVLTGPSVSFSFTNAQRVTTYANPAHYRPAVDPRPAVSLAVRAVGSPLGDEAVVYFEAGATAGLDRQHDGEKPAHNQGLPTLVSLTANAAELTVNGLPTTALVPGIVVELLLDLPAAGTYELTAPALANLPATVTPLLLDRLTNTRYTVSQQATVTFTAAQAGEVRGRYALVFGPAGTVTGQAEVASTTFTAWPNPAHGTLNVALVGTQPGATLTLRDALGRVVRQQYLAATATDLSFDVRALPAGVYTLSADAAAGEPARTLRVVLE